MQKVRLISSPQMDYSLAPAEQRRYINQITGWFAFSFLTILTVCLLYCHAKTGLNLPKLAWLIYIKDPQTLATVNYPSFLFLSGLSLAISGIPSFYFMRMMTKPISRMQIKSGNYLDETEEVFSNISREFKSKKQDTSICLIRKGDGDFNNEPPKIIAKKDSGLAIPKRFVSEDVHIPKSILELSTIIRGEAGGGKTLLADRLMKEFIGAGHKLILHNIKGDEFNKLNGHCPFYLIEPWNRKAGYAISFLSLLNRKREEDRNAYIMTFVRSFCSKSASKGDSFFDDSAIEVLFAVVKKVVEDEMEKPIYKAGLVDIVNLWISFQADTAPEQAITDDPVKLLANMQQKAPGLEKIKALLREKNPTQADLIDANNPKTSLCILATCTKTIKKMEVLAKFWGNREHEKSLDLVKWLNTKEDRPVLLLSNSNLYKSEADAYISATINLLTVFLINNEYQPTSDVHFFLDEFPQLSSIDLDVFMKLPDVGRGKKVHVEIAMQRSSQVKEVWNKDPFSFCGAFQNKYWARPATDDLENMKNEIGKQDVIEFSVTQNWNAQGKSSSMKTTGTTKDAINPNAIQNELGPIEYREKFCGVRILMKFSNFSRVPVATFPPVVFEKTLKKLKVKSVAGNSPVLPIDEPTHNDSEDLQKAQEVTQEPATQLDTLLAQIEHEPAQEPVDKPEHESLAKELVSEAIDEALHHFGGETASAIWQAMEMMEHLEHKNENSNVAQVTDEKPAESTDKKSMALLAIAKLKQEKDRGSDR